MTTPLEWELHPSREKWSSCEARTWLSKCGRLKLYEITDPHARRGEEVIRYGACHRRDGYWDAVETDIKLGPGYPLYYKKFVLAVEAAERYLAERTKDEIQSNKAELVKSYCIEVSISEDEGDEIMATTNVLKVNEEKVREMLTEAGFATAAQWTPKRLLSKLKGLPSVKDECQELEGEQKELFDSILAAIEAGDEVRLESGEEEEKPTKKTKGKVKKAESEGEDNAEEEEVGEGEEVPPKKAKKANTKKTSVRKGKTEPEENGEEEETPKSKKVKVKKTEPEEEEAPVKGKKAKVKGKEKAPPKKDEKGPSNKLQVYTAWKKSKGKSDVPTLHGIVNEAVKETTIRGWVSQWGKGENLPAGAK